MSINFSLNVSELAKEKALYKFYFVKKANEFTKHMKSAYEATKEKIFIDTQSEDEDDEWIKVISSEECINIPKAEFKKKKHIFIFDDFSGPAFDYLSQTSNVQVFGVKALQATFSEDITTSLSHVHNFAFKDIKVCCSALKPDKKAEIRQLSNYMGGLYLDVLTSDVTHLVTESVTSVKYEEAAKNKIHIMHPDWVKNVWKFSQNPDFRATGDDPQFDRFKLPIFFNLCVSTSGLANEIKSSIKTNIEGNGGRYTGVFNRTVDILIVNKNQLMNDKIKAAKKLDKMILSPDWVSDSVAQGFAVSFNNYIIKFTKTSTPEKLESTLSSVQFKGDNDDISAIFSSTSVHKSNLSTFDETQHSTKMSTRMSSRHEHPYKKVLRKLTPQAAKKAGSILDGLTIFLYGFAADELNKLGKMLCACGAVKVGDFNDQVTHVLVGKNDEDLLVTLEAHEDVNPTVLKIDWFVACVEQKELIDETAFVIERPSKASARIEPPSPASKKAMKSMSSNFKMPSVPKMFEEKEDKENQDQMEMIISQYVDAPADTTAPDTQQHQMLLGKKIFLYDYEAEERLVIGVTLEKLGATIVNANCTEEVDYIIASSIMIENFNSPVQNYQHLVHSTWLEESIEADECLEVAFYHKPLIKFDESEQPLKGENIVVSNYKGLQRVYIKHLVMNLGGTFKEELKRVDQPILICPKAEGMKFKSALGWQLAVLPVEWLIECNKCRYRVDETEFLIGGSMPSKNNMVEVPSSQPISDSSPFLIHKRVNDLKAPGETSKSPSPDPNFSLLCSEFPTPQRKVTKAVLIEMREKNKNLETPRARCLEGSLNSPYPELPECMKPLDKDYSIRPDSSPASQYFHKRKLEGLDSNYVSRPAEKKRKCEESMPETPIAIQRYDFYKANISGYDSPDPRQKNGEYDPKEKQTSNATLKDFEQTENDNKAAEEMLNNLENKSATIEVSDNSLVVPDLDE